MKVTAMPMRHPLRLTRRRRLALYGIGLGLWLTGVLWLVFHYFMVQDTSFGPSPHPLEHWWLSLHGLFAFATLWMFGFLWSAHIVGGWKSQRRRISGSLLFAALVLLVASGYLLYYPPTEESLPLIALLHWILGLAAILPFLGHRFWQSAVRSSQAARTVPSDKRV